jgi:small conductance mechanosensitive channel
MEELSTARLSNFADTLLALVMRYGPRLLLAIVVLCGGLWIINRVMRALALALEGRALEPTLGQFLTSVASIVLKTLLLISVGSMIGIATTSFVAMLGAAGLAVGLALQGSLANFAGGVLILLFRPFRVGDYIEGQGVAGTVASIQIIYTLIKTPDNKLISVPNGPLSNGVVTNYSALAARRIELTVGMGYGSDIAHAKRVIGDLLRADHRVHGDPAPVVVVTALAETTVRLTLRAWVGANDFWDVQYDLLERIKGAFETNGVAIALGPHTVHAPSGS